MSTTLPSPAPGTELAVRLLHLRPCVIRLDAAYWGLKLIAWIHTTLGAQAVIPSESQAAETPGWLAADLDGPGAGQTRQY